MPVAEPPEVTEYYAGITRVLNLTDSRDRRAGDCKYGAYLFVDYDGEPIYVGQTSEKLRTRIGRHLTNRRTDAAAMRVLDPIEVAEIEMWPFWDLHAANQNTPKEGPARTEFNITVAKVLAQAEFTVYCRAIEQSRFQAMLNEAEIGEAAVIDLPESVRGEILPTSSRQKSEHPDIRLARRARTFADLARVISERKVSVGIRRTLWVQGRRLEHMARSRLDSFDQTNPSRDS